LFTINIGKINLNSINVIKIALAVFNNLIDQSFEYTYTLFKRHEIYHDVRYIVHRLPFDIFTEKIRFNHISRPKLYMGAHLFVLYEFFVQGETLQYSYSLNTFRY